MVHADGFFFLQGPPEVTFWYAAPCYIQIYNIYGVHYMCQILFLLFILLPLNPLLSPSSSALLQLTNEKLFIAMKSPEPACAWLLSIPCLHPSTLHPLSPLLKVSAVTLGLSFSVLYLRLWFLTLMCVKLGLYPAEINKSKAN